MFKKLNPTTRVTTIEDAPVVYSLIRYAVVAVATAGAAFVAGRGVDRAFNVEHNTVKWGEDPEDPEPDTNPV